jgi:dolichol-phosphate mannosyltransferase
MENEAIIIPAFNEEKNIKKIVHLIRDKTQALIIIVDDSANSKSKNIIVKEKINNLLYYHRKKKLGRGSAIVFGFKKILKSKRKINCFIEMDADLSHNPNELIRNISFFYKHSIDLLIASRYLKKSKIINWPTSRKILSRLSNMLARIFLGVPVKDYTNGFRFYSKRAAKVVASECKNLDGFIILSEILLRTYRKNYKILEINTIFKNRVRGESTVNVDLILKSFLGLLKLFFLKIFKKI